MSKAIKFALGFYAAAAIITFGHSASTYEPRCDGERAFCTDVELQVTGAFLGALLWPLYWSWELQS